MEYINNMTIAEIVAIVVAAETFIKFIFVYLEKYYKYRQNEDNETKSIKDLKQKVDVLNNKLTEDEQNAQNVLEVLKMQCRFYLVESCLNCLKENKIQSTKLQSIKDLYAAYHTIGGDEYVTDLVERVKEVQIED